jgi:hypothetical protein
MLGKSLRFSIDAHPTKIDSKIDPHFSAACRICSQEALESRLALDRGRLDTS